MNADPDRDLDPLVRGKDPRIRIRIKMSQIPNTDFKWLNVLLEQLERTHKSTKIIPLLLVEGKKTPKILHQLCQAASIFYRPLLSSAAELSAHWQR